MIYCFVKELNKKTIILVCKGYFGRCLLNLYNANQIIFLSSSSVSTSSIDYKKNNSYNYITVFTFNLSFKESLHCFTKKKFLK